MAAQIFPGDINKYRVLLFLNPPMPKPSSTILVTEGETLEAVTPAYNLTLGFYLTLWANDMLIGGVAIFTFAPGRDPNTPYRG